MKNNRSLTALAVAVIAVFSVGFGLPATAEPLTILDWSGYEDPELRKAYTAAHPEAPSYSFFANEDEAFQKVKSGFKPDLVHPCLTSLPRWLDAELLEPVDPAALKSWAELGQNFKDLPNVQKDGKVWMVPMDWGYSGLVTTDAVPAEDAKSLAIFAAPQYKGKVAIGDNVDEAYALAYLATGVKDWSKADEAAFAKASAFLREVHKNVRFYWQDNTALVQSMASGEIAVTWGYADIVAKLVEAGKKATLNRGAKEGVSTWVCGYARVKGAVAPAALQQAYIDAATDKASAQHMVTNWGQGHANLAGLAAAGPDVLAQKGFGNVAETLTNSLFQSALSPAQRARMVAEFEKIKAGY